MTGSTLPPWRGTCAELHAAASRHTFTKAPSRYPMVVCHALQLGRPWQQPSANASEERRGRDGRQTVMPSVIPDCGRDEDPYISPLASTTPPRVTSSRPSATRPALSPGKRRASRSTPRVRASTTPPALRAMSRAPATASLARRTTSSVPSLATSPSRPRAKPATTRARPSRRSTSAHNSLLVGEYLLYNSNQ